MHRLRPCRSCRDARLPPVQAVGEKRNLRSARSAPRLQLLTVAVATDAYAAVLRSGTLNTEEQSMPENVPNYDVVADLKQIPWKHIDGGDGKTMESQLIFDGADG